MGGEANKSEMINTLLSELEGPSSNNRQWHRCLFLPCFPDPEINGVLFLFLPIKDIGDIREMISQMGGEVNKYENVNTLLCELEGPSCYNLRLVTISLCNNISDGWCGV